MSIVAEPVDETGGDSMKVSRDTLSGNSTRMSLSNSLQAIRRFPADHSSQLPVTSQVQEWKDVTSNQIVAAILLPVPLIETVDLEARLGCLGMKEIRNRGHSPNKISVALVEDASRLHPMLVMVSQSKLHFGGPNRSRTPNQISRPGSYRFENLT